MNCCEVEFKKCLTKGYILIFMKVLFAYHPLFIIRYELWKVLKILHMHLNMGKKQLLHLLKLCYATLLTFFIIAENFVNQEEIVTSELLANFAKVELFKSILNELICKFCEHLNILLFLF